LNTLDPLRSRFVKWLADAAYPLWFERGIDARTGGFAETLSQEGVALPHPRRARVHPRQVYAFAQARTFGWRGDVTGIVSRGMDYFTTYYQRPDGLFRTMVDTEGAPLNGSALLYDQAFALLGYAAAAIALEARGEFESRALALRHAIEAHFAADDGSYYSEEHSAGHRESNPHMHLLEAYLAWAEIGHDSGWAAGVRRIVDVALSRFIREDSGALGESYLATWQPTPGSAGHVIEPGHQFEWAWLLLRCEPWYRLPLREPALRLISIGEDLGVHNGVAVNALHDDFTVKDGNARLWPQTERLKAALLAAALTGEPTFWSMAEAAAMSWIPYLNTPVPGLWLDVRLPSGEFVDSPAPASTFYHLVGAVVALDRALGSSERAIRSSLV
jgi:mannose/cellobiose epimerase-like protein (N-acyl-D-glucosamine 2-epimerase family)